jgi:TolB-like protein/Tfp pilus assembly protein PilF
MATGEQPLPNPKAQDTVGQPPGRRLDSWKEIASWFGRSERTVRRWEEREGMPVHRLLHEKRGTVYAYSGELEEWRQSRNLLASECASGEDRGQEDGLPDPVLQDAGEGEPSYLQHLTAAQDNRGAPASDNRKTPRRRLRLVWFLSGAGCAAVLLGFWLALHREVAERSTSSEPHIAALVVLPLGEIGSDKTENYFADGVTEELITELGRLISVRVISRTSAFSVRKSALTPPEIGRQLNVDALVEGTVRRSGDRIRIVARLVSVAPEHLIWSKAYEGDRRDILSLQRDVAFDIVSGIRAKLNQQGAPASALKQRLDPRAHEDYLRGRYFLARRDEEGMREAAGWFESAIQREPRYAQAYSGLAVSYVLLGMYSVQSPESTFRPAIEYANKALALDDSVSEAYTARGAAISFYELDWAASERDFQHAIALDPSSALAHHWYGEHFTNVGQADRAVFQLKLARELDPLSLAVNAFLGRAYRDAHHYDEAVQQCQYTLKLDPNFAMGHWCLAKAYMGKNEYALVLAEAKRAATLVSASFLISDLGCAYALLGKKAEARAVLKGLQKRARSTYGSPYLVASIYSTLGEKDAAFEWLQKAYAGRDRVGDLATDPVMDPLRSDPRFVSLLHRMNLPRD